MDDDELEARVEALERAVTDGDHDLSELATKGETRERLAAAETELGDLADRVAELEAATQALRGYVGNVRAVNRDIEQRADTALAKAESVESALTGDEQPDAETRRSEHAVADGHGHDPAGGGTTRSGEEVARDRGLQAGSESPSGAAGGDTTPTAGGSPDPDSESNGVSDRERSTGTAGGRARVGETGRQDTGYGHPDTERNQSGQDTEREPAGRADEHGLAGRGADRGPAERESAGRDTSHGPTERDVGRDQGGDGGERTNREVGHGNQGADDKRTERCDACGRPTPGHHTGDGSPPRSGPPEQGAERPRAGRSAPGRSTAGQTREQPAEEMSTGRRPTRDNATPGETSGGNATPGQSADRSTAGGEPGWGGDGPTAGEGDPEGGDPLGAVFESDESDESGADGTFDRIRQML